MASRILRPVPRLHSCMTRLGLSASMAAEAIRARRFGDDQSGIARETIRAAFQARHATSHWLPYNRRPVGAWWRVGAPAPVGAFRENPALIAAAKEALALAEPVTDKPVGASPRYVVDGHEFPNDESSLLGDGGFPPFVVFDVEAQDNLPGTYATREAAQEVADRLNLAPVGAGPDAAIAAVIPPWGYR